MYCKCIKQIQKLNATARIHMLVSYAVCVYTLSSLKPGFFSTTFGVFSRHLSVIGFSNCLDIKENPLSLVREL